MNFKEAIESVKQGHKVARKSWLEENGSTRASKTKALMLVSGAKAPYRGIGQIDIEPFVALYFVAGTISAYVPTRTDEVAKDWKILN